MSFSGEVKEELVRLVPEARHCQLAELAALLEYAQAVKIDENGAFFIEIMAETPYVVQKGFTLLEKTFNIESKMSVTSNRLCLTDTQQVNRILQAIKYESECIVDPLVIKSLCCKRAFLRGVFLGIGSMSNPERGYHLEFVCENEPQAAQIIEALTDFEIEGRVVQRKRYRIVYIKESEEIVELLNVMGAHRALMNLENLRILKDMRNSINRKVNCEAANITKTVNAAAKQIEDITYIREHYGFHNLSDPLREIAEVRLEYPDATLKELGEYLTPAVGKSGVNHRLRKLGELADRLRR